MPTITLFTTQRQQAFASSITGNEIAKWANNTTSSQAIALEVEGKGLFDLSRLWHEDMRCCVVYRQEPKGLEVLRHDLAHVLAQAVKELFPQTKVGIGPVIEDGFYYDFLPQTPFSQEDLQAIEDRMHHIVDRNDTIQREEWDREKALHFFHDQKELFKKEIIEALSPQTTISCYRQGNFTDLCRGPHAPSTKILGHAFKLTHFSAAYWRGDAKNPSLQRIYGTGWAHEKDLKNHLWHLEERKKRDHRRLGKEMKLFHFQEEAPGHTFWHPRGWAVYQTLVDFMRTHTKNAGYDEVRTPQLIHKKLWEASGHWEKFRHCMFTCDVEGQSHALKPMNCPGHVQIFQQGIRSYKDLPLRFFEFCSLFRHESSGSLMGLMRVQCLAQDDGHIFCMPHQVSQETKDFCEFLKKIYAVMGFEEFAIRFADRPPLRAGDDATWDVAEESLKQGAKDAGLSYTHHPGEGAFYGPKLEFVLKDAVGRQWQCGTLQVDFIMPQRLKAFYTGEDGKRHHPVMLHRAVLGSFERFLGMLIEHHGGRLPLWLAPVQVVVASVTQEAEAHGKKILHLLEKAGVRAIGDWRNEKITYKIRQLTLEKVGMIWVVGQKEALDNTVAVRLKNQQKTLEVLDAIDRVQKTIDKRLSCFDL